MGPGAVSLSGVPVVLTAQKRAGSAALHILRSLVFRLGTGEWGHAAFAHGELFPAPADLVGGEAGQPNDEMDGVSEWDEPELPADDFVTDYADTYGPRHDEAQDQIGQQVGCGD